MKSNVIVTKNFEKNSKKLLKKYPSLKDDISDLILKLEGNPRIGIPIGNNIYKIRVSISSKNKGKSAGARVFTYLKLNIMIGETDIFLLNIYDKSDISNILKEEINQLIKEIEE
ncbi:MAG: hypothetical protein AABZ74_07810 [Cyanobacteriota bacterium]